MTAEDVRKRPEYKPALLISKIEMQARADAKAELAPREDWTDWKSITGYAAPTPNTFTRDDGKPLGYRGCLHSVWGWGGAGKSWLCAMFAAIEVTAGYDVYWIDLEGQRGSLAPRFRALGLSDESITKYVRYNNPESAPDVDRLRTACAGSLIVIDSFTGLQNRVAPGSSSNDTDAVDLVYSSVLVPLLNAGCTVLIIDHVTKERATGADSPIGSQRKYSMIDVGWNLVERDGFSALYVRKDRHSNFERNEHVADLQFAAGIPNLPAHADVSAMGGNVTLAPAQIILYEVARRVVADEPCTTNMLKLWLAENCEKPKMGKTAWEERIKAEIDAGHVEEYARIERGGGKYLRLPEDPPVSQPSLPADLETLLD
jgi:KaiC/GvpD/RAD55 family RecA-like ATPase